MELGIERGLGKEFKLGVEPLPFKLHRNYCRKNSLEPYINENCRLCSACIRICPAGAISEMEGAYFINDKCIKCYCCLESCKYNGISFR